MNKCKRCGSYAINHNLHGRDGSYPELCDVCYYRIKLESSEAELEDRKHLEKKQVGMLMEIDRLKAELESAEENVAELKKLLKVFASHFGWSCSTAYANEDYQRAMELIDEKSETWQEGELWVSSD